MHSRFCSAVSSAIKPGVEARPGYNTVFFRYTDQIEVLTEYFGRDNFFAIFARV